jgi:hypothetical protein
MKIENVVFFFPCKSIGGGQYLFIRYADSIAKYFNNRIIYFVDYEDGFARKQLGENKQVHFIEYKDNSKIKIPANSVVINSLNHIRHFNNQLLFEPDKTAFIFWCISFYDIYLPKPITFFGINKCIKECLPILTQKGVIKYLGETASFFLAKQYSTRFVDSEYLPLLVPTEKYINKWHKSRNAERLISFCWLGRLDKDKSNDIISYMNELECLNKKFPLKFSLIGNGSEFSNLEKFSHKYNYDILFVGEKRDEELDAFIRENVDIGLASGTSSLEFALRKVPVIQLWKPSKIFKAGECTSYHRIGSRLNVAQSSSSNIVICGQTSFEKIFCDIWNNYEVSREQDFLFAMSKSPSEGAQKMNDSINYLEHNYDINTYEQIIKMSDALEKGHKLREKLYFLKKNRSFFIDYLLKWNK